MEAFEQNCPAVGPVVGWDELVRREGAVCGPERGRNDEGRSKSYPIPGPTCPQQPHTGGCLIV
jgi:hypothetical protein